MSNEIIRPNAVNVIQDGLDNIVRAWGNRCGGSRGSRRVSVNEVATREVINTWISWLRFYAGNVGANAHINGLNEIPPNTLLRKNIIDDIYSRTPRIVNHCNRSECNKRESNQRESNRSYESNTRSECNHHFESNKGWER